MSSHKKVILAKLSLNRGRVCDLMDAPYPGAPEKELATSFCYCSNRIWKQTKWFLVDIAGFWILLLPSLLTSKGEKEKQWFLFWWCIAHAFSIFDFIFPVLLFAWHFSVTYTSWGSTSLEWNFHLCQVRKRVFSLVLSIGSWFAGS